MNNETLSALGPLYHSFSVLGLDNEQLPGIFEKNQQAKCPIITAYILYSIAKSKETTSDKVSFTELFCADAFYAMFALKFGCTEAYAIDRGLEKYFHQGKEIARQLQLDVKFIEASIEPTSKFTITDIVANVGGLYHVNDPVGVLKMSYSMARKFLIVQSVVSLANTSNDYFETPPPGRTYGSRFSRSSFDKMIRSLNYEIIDCHFNELEGNDRLEDRGSAYYLIRK